MRIAAFDLGTTFAVAASEGVFHVDLNPDRAKAKKRRERPEVLGLFAACLAEALTEGTADVVVYERPFARGQAATRLLWGMAGILEAAAHNAGIPVLDMTPAEIKKWAAGHGKADKEEMIEAAQLMGYGGDNEHEADAWCLLKFAQATLTKE